MFACRDFRFSQVDKGRSEISRKNPRITGSGPEMTQIGTGSWSIIFVTVFLRCLVSHLLEVETSSFHSSTEEGCEIMGKIPDLPEMGRKCLKSVPEIGVF